MSDLEKVDNIKRPSVLFQVLTRGHIRGELALFMMYLVKNNYPVSVHFGRSGYMACDRNSGVDEWYSRTTAEYLIQCDEDMIVPVDTLRLALNEKDICALSCLYVGDHGPTVAAKALPGTDPQIYPAKPGEPAVAEVEWIGTGVYCISRQAAKRFIDEQGCVFKFDVKEDGSVGAGVDVHMCHRARDLGMKVWLDRSLVAGHSKVLTWTPAPTGALTYQKWGTMWRADNVPMNEYDKANINDLFMLDPTDTSLSQLIIFNKELMARVEG